MDTSAVEQRIANGKRTFVIEGEIAAGKTELTKAIAAELTRRGKKVCLVLEPVEQWRSIGILQKFYSDPMRFGYGFQTYVFASRVLEIAKAVSASPDADVFLLERSPASDQIFMELQRGVIDPVEMEMYSTWCDAYNLMLPIDFSNAKVLYLKTSLEHCMERLNSRHRDGEVISTKPKEKVASATATGGVSIGYQQRLRRAHEAFLEGLNPGEFPFMPKSPFPISSVYAIEPALADGNFRDLGPERDRIIGAIVDTVEVLYSRSVSSERP